MQEQIEKKPIPPTGQTEMEGCVVWILGFGVIILIIIGVYLYMCHH